MLPGNFFYLFLTLYIILHYVVDAEEVTIVVLFQCLKCLGFVPQFLPLPQSGFIIPRGSPTPLPFPSLPFP